MAAPLITTPWQNINKYVACGFHFLIFKKSIVVGRIMASKDVHTLNPGGCEYVTLHGNRLWGDFPGVSGAAQSNHLSPSKWMRKARELDREIP